MAIRSFGWIQNPSSFSNLKKTVQIFDSSSLHYADLRDNTIENEIIYFEDIKNNLLHKLNSNISVFDYYELVGKNRDKNGVNTGIRAKQEADSLIKISILPQSVSTRGRRFTDTWTSDGFLRWAVSLNFVSHDIDTDEFMITPFGLEFSGSIDGSDEEINILRKAILSYPPALQVLRILNRESPLGATKFHIGSQLGFVGEAGFTSYDENLMVKWLKKSKTNEERTSIRADIEGTSDKYARTILSWLINLGLVEGKSTSLENDYTEIITGFRNYFITAEGIHSLRKADGNSRNPQIAKYLKWEFLASKDSNANYLRTRRAYILEILKTTQSFDVLISKLEQLGFNEDKKIIINDISGLIQIGIRMEFDGNNRIKLLDNILGLEIPNLAVTTQMVDRVIADKKNEFLTKTDLDPKYINLIDLAFDGSSNRAFEVLTIELLDKVYGLDAELLGGGRKPDGIVYTKNYGIIIDTKAYSRGYGKNITQEDEMVRYIEDNIEKDCVRNTNKWWETFPSSIGEDSYYYLWSSGKFIGDFEEQLESTNRRTGYNGGAITAEQLLWGAVNVMDGTLNIADIPNYMTNKIIEFR